MPIHHLLYIIFSPAYTNSFYMTELLSILKAEGMHFCGEKEVSQHAKITALMKIKAGRHPCKLRWQS